MTTVALPPQPSLRLRATATALVVAAAAAALAGALAIAHGETRTQTTAYAIATLIAGCSFVTAGAVAVLRESARNTGLLMIFAGFALLGASMAQSSRALPFTIGLVIASLPAAILAHLVLRFPDDHLHSRSERIAVVLAYIDATVLQVAMLMFMGFAHVRGCPCPDNLLLVSMRERVHGVLMSTERFLGIVLAVWIGVLVARRWLAASPPVRRASTPLLAMGVLWTLLLGLSLVLTDASGPVRYGFATTERVALAVVPFAFLLGLLQARLARGSVSDLLVELDRLDTPGRLRDALARALRDPSLEVAYRLSDDEGYVGIDGQPIEVGETPTRSVTVLERNGHTVAALIHDPALLEDRTLLDAVSSAAGLTLENERLQAELRAQLEELRESRTRIVEAGDNARRALERNLHDGAQQRLVTLSVGLALVEGKIASDPEAARRLLADARRELAAGLEELRELARGLHPAILHRGVEPAVTALAERSAVPVVLRVQVRPDLPTTISATAYYVVSEALTNVARYSGASEVEVRVETTGDTLTIEIADDGSGGAAIAPGSGLEGLRDRVQAVGGQFEVTSPPGAGTRIFASLPL